MLSGDVFLQTATQFNLHAVVSLGPIVHQQKVGVVVIEAGQPTLALDVHQIMGGETTLPRTRWQWRSERKSLYG